MTRSMTTLAAALAVLALLAAPAGAQSDLTSMLVGRWDGEIELARGTYPRSLIVKAVQVVGGKATAEAEYGGGGQDIAGQVPAMSPVAPTVEAYGANVVLKFVSPEGFPIQLSLSPDRRHLYGDLRISIGIGGTRPINPIRLTKVG